MQNIKIITFCVALLFLNACDNDEARAKKSKAEYDEALSKKHQFLESEHGKDLAKEFKRQQDVFKSHLGKAWQISEAKNNPLLGESTYLEIHQQQYVTNLENLLGKAYFNRHPNFAKYKNNVVKLRINSTSPVYTINYQHGLFEDNSPRYKYPEFLISPPKNQFPPRPIDYRTLDTVVTDVWLYKDAEIIIPNDEPNIQSKANETLYIAAKSTSEDGILQLKLHGIASDPEGYNSNNYGIICGFGLGNMFGNVPKEFACSFLVGNISATAYLPREITPIYADIMQEIAGKK